MALKPNDRYPDFEQVIQDLESVIKAGAHAQLPNIDLGITSINVATGVRRRAHRPGGGRGARAGKARRREGDLHKELRQELKDIPPAILLAIKVAALLIIVFFVYVLIRPHLPK